MNDRKYRWGGTLRIWRRWVRRRGYRGWRRERWFGMYLDTRTRRARGTSRRARSVGTGRRDSRRSKSTNSRAEGKKVMMSPRPVEGPFRDASGARCGLGIAHQSPLACVHPRPGRAAFATRAPLLCTASHRGLCFLRLESQRRSRNPSSQNLYDCQLTCELLK